VREISLTHGLRSCENIELGFFRPRVFSYLQAKKSGFFNNFTASYAVGYILTPAPRAGFFEELLTQDTS
jgi:hypothetical protein